MSSMRLVKKLRVLLSVVGGFVFSLVIGVHSSFVYGNNSSDFFILDKADGGQQAVLDIANEGGGVWDRYDEEAHNNPQLAGEENLANQIQTGIMTWDTIIYFLVNLLQFLSQLGMLIGVLMIIFVGYQYASYSITGIEPKQSYITHVIIGILVISFSYAILQIVTEAFL